MPDCEPAIRRQCSEDSEDHGGRSEDLDRRGGSSARRAEADRSGGAAAPIAAPQPAGGTAVASALLVSLQQQQQRTMERACSCLDPAARGNGVWMVGHALAMRTPSRHRTGSGTGEADLRFWPGEEEAGEEQTATIASNESILGTDESSLGVDESILGADESSIGADESSIGPDESSIGPDESSMGVDMSGGSMSSISADASGGPVLTSPPTPAPSPRPKRALAAATNESTKGLRLCRIREEWLRMRPEEQRQCMVELLDCCNPSMLMFISSIISPRLKRDFLGDLPAELGLRILSHIDDPQTLARASQVSRRWHELVNDDLTWKNLCRGKHQYRRPSVVADWSEPEDVEMTRSVSRRSARKSSASRDSTDGYLHKLLSRSYKSHFRYRWMIENAWLRGGHVLMRHVTSDYGMVTSLLLAGKYIVVSVDNSKIHVFEEDGYFLRTLIGHESGVWALAICGTETLVSGGCDREMRIWDLPTGRCLKVLRGHTSTVRCLKMQDQFGSPICVSGSRDTTLRIWNVIEGSCRRVLLGHQASVRCLDVCGDICVSGSYDTTARVWSISRGQCLRVLSGHFSQIYAVSFDGVRVATGSLDSHIRVWDSQTGFCLATLTGHTSLVGQLQIRGNALVTGGSDGSVRVWDLQNMKCIHRLAAHDNSVTAIQFDDRRIVSAGSDGHVKGAYIRDLAGVTDSVWRVAFDEDRIVVLGSTGGRACMEVISFLPTDVLEANMEKRRKERGSVVAAAVDGDGPTDETVEV